MAQPSPKSDALRAAREAKFDREQRRMKEEQGRMVEKPTAIAKKKAVPKKIARKNRDEG
jgi:hypothetical protein